MRSRMYYAERKRYESMGPIQRFLYRIRRLFWR